MHNAYLSLGSNMGNKANNIIKALNSISVLPNTSLELASSFIETKAWGNTNQDDFVNAACLIKTNLNPTELLKNLLKIEAELGRVRTEKWGPRIIDIDIIFYDDLVLTETELVIPHPFCHMREFVLKPLIELNPDFVHPILKTSITMLYNKLICEK